ncbi:2123_t:CDS:2 [Acaulospora colombiana]|uniref:2123_t:CDS:1 n=1 Tax=Acaulospora colombiana TaxID=27376 RepID=A0ACA9M1E8_9GLOM|nr:2123_t:CDS:2 [Acaulospora colombiana]
MAIFPHYYVNSPDVRDPASLQVFTPPLSGKSRRYPHLGLLPHEGEAHDGCLGIGQNRVPLIDQNEGNEGKIDQEKVPTGYPLPNNFPVPQTRKFRFPTVLRMLVLPLVFLSFAELLYEGVVDRRFCRSGRDERVEKDLRARGTHLLTASTILELATELSLIVYPTSSSSPPPVPQPQILPTTYKMGRVLLTGASEFIAAHVLDEFLKNGHLVRFTVRTLEKADQTLQANMKYKDQLEGAYDVALQDKSLDGGTRGILEAIVRSGPGQVETKLYSGSYLCHPKTLHTERTV